MDKDNNAKIVGETVNIREGGAFLIQGQTVDIKEGGAAVIVAENIRIQEGGGGVLLAKQAEISDGGVLFLAAREVSGNATIIFDLKAAVVFGLIAGLTISLYKLIAGRS